MHVFIPPTPPPSHPMSLHFIPREKYWILLKPALGRVSFAAAQVCAGMFGVQIWCSWCVPGTMPVVHNKTFASLHSLWAWLWLSCLWKQTWIWEVNNDIIQPIKQKGTWRVVFPKGDCGFFSLYWLPKTKHKNLKTNLLRKAKQKECELDLISTPPEGERRDLPFFTSVVTAEVILHSPLAWLTPLHSPH